MTIEGTEERERCRSLDGCRVGESSRLREAALADGNYRESRGFALSCRLAGVAMGTRFDIVDCVANWAFFHVNSGCSRSPAPGESARASERAKPSPGRQLAGAAACAPKLLQSQAFSGPTRARIASGPSARSGASVAPDWYVDCTSRDTGRLTSPFGVADAGNQRNTRDGHE